MTAPFSQNFWTQDLSVQHQSLSASKHHVASIFSWPAGAEEVGPLMELPVRKWRIKQLLALHLLTNTCVSDDDVDHVDTP